MSFEEDLSQIESLLEQGDAKLYFNAPSRPSTVLEALEQRLAKYQSTLEDAIADENSSKVRRLGRIVKQYEHAIKDHLAGKEVLFNELPTPPGFSDIPINTLHKPQPSPLVNRKIQQRPEKESNPCLQPLNSAANSESIAQIKPTQPIKSHGLRPDPTQPSSTTKPSVVLDPPVKNVAPKPPPRQLKRGSSIADKQMKYLLERQIMFREAALESKKNGDIQQAKEYLRQAKGFDPLIEATKNGLPIDSTSIPTPPQMNEDFVVVSRPDLDGSFEDSSKEEMYRKVEMELQNQISMCKKNKDYFLKLGDVSSSSKFEKYAIESKKDLDMLQNHWQNNDKVPLFRYETRSFSIVINNIDIGLNEISIEVIKAFDLLCKNDIDSYIRVEFPFPNDEHQFFKTRTIKNTLEPEFKETFKFLIDRKSRQLPRVLKRHPVKFELYSKGGLFKSDVLVGTASVKLTDFETKCTIHDTFMFMEGKKTTLGKLEVRAKIREPLLAKQIEEVKEKWLVFK